MRVVMRNAQLVGWSGKPAVSSQLICNGIFPQKLLLLRHFYIIFHLSSGPCVTLVKDTFVLQSLLREHIFDRKEENCWLKVGSEKRDTSSVPIVSSPHLCRVIVEFSHKTSIPLHSPCFCLFVCLFFPLSQHTRLPWCLLTN